MRGIKAMSAAFVAAATLFVLAPSASSQAVNATADITVTCNDQGQQQFTFTFHNVSDAVETIDNTAVTFGGVLAGDPPMSQFNSPIQPGTDSAFTVIRIADPLQGVATVVIPFSIVGGGDETITGSGTAALCADLVTTTTTTAPPDTTPDPGTGGEAIEPVPATPRFTG